MIEVVLVEPEIPPNTGNVIRLAANTGAGLHLVGPLGFSMDDALLRRAGLDYHEHARVRVHAGWDAFMRDAVPAPARMHAFTTTGTTRFDAVDWQPGDWLLFGAESRGLPAHVRAAIDPARHVRLPMRPGQRSLNLGNAVAVAVFEAWRRFGYAGSV